MGADENYELDHGVIQVNSGITVANKQQKSTGNNKIYEKQ
jgi:hypothetical protein